MIPLIFIKAHGDIPMAVRAMKAGAFEFLPKPLRTEDLLLAIREALERDRKEWCSVPSSPACEGGEIA